MAAYVLDLRFVDATPRLTRHIAWGSVAAALVLTAAAIAAWLTPFQICCSAAFALPCEQNRAIKDTRIAFRQRWPALRWMRALAILAGDEQSCH